MPAFSNAAISNGTDYTNGLWHIGICMNAGCHLVLSNSPFKSEFSWLTDADFDGAFDQYPGETTFYRIVQPSVGLRHETQPTQILDLIAPIVL